MGRGPDPRRSSHPLTPLFSTGIDRVPAHHSPVASRTLLDIFMRIQNRQSQAFERITGLVHTSTSGDGAATRFPAKNGAAGLTRRPNNVTSSRGTLPSGRPAILCQETPEGRRSTTSRQVVLSSNSLSRSVTQSRKPAHSCRTPGCRRSCRALPQSHPAPTPNVMISTIHATVRPVGGRSSSASMPQPRKATKSAKRAAYHAPGPLARAGPAALAGRAGASRRSAPAVCGPVRLWVGLSPPSRASPRL